MNKNISRFFKGFAAGLLLFATVALAQTASTEEKNLTGKSQVLKAEARVATPERSEATPADVKSDQGATAQSAPKSGPVGYRIGEQDVLTITVWREPELSGTVMVRPDGMVTLPLVNDVHASGLTPDELRDFLTEKLRTYVNVPQVTVSVREINSRKVFVIGQVGREGSYRINSTSTVLQIIAEAGGLKDFANKKGIYVLRNQNGSQVRLAFNYDKVIRAKGNHDNIQLQPGDTIVVP